MRKPKHSIVVWFLTYAVCAMSLCVLPACRTVGPDGQPVYDPIRSEQVVAALTVPVQDAITRIIRNSPEHSDELAGYFRAIGNVACVSDATKVFTPEQLLTEIDKATGHLQAKLPPLAITLKNTTVALYTIFWAERMRAELPPDTWPSHVMTLLCKAIDEGLRDAGKPGVDTHKP